MLLVGYSLDDDDFRGIWHILNNRLGGMTQPAYCIVVGASQAKIARYARRNIHVINLPGEGKDYKTILRDFFIEIKKYISEERDKTVTSKDDRINEQLVIPSDSNRLCFISCTTKRIAQLSSLLYPILYDLGVTPARLDDLLMPGDNWIDTVETIIRKSKYAIVDVTDDSPSVLTELAILEEEKKTLQVICERSVELSSSWDKYNVLRYSLDDEENKSFKQQLTKWINGSNKAKEEPSTVFMNANRLLEKKEYSA